MVLHMYNTSAMLSHFRRAGATLLVVVNELLALYIRCTHNVKRSLKKRNTARSANLHVLVYTLLYRKVPQKVAYTWFTVEKHSVAQ